MPKRKPLECGVFRDIETAEKYDKEAAGWMRMVSKSFVSAARKWGVTDGQVLDVGTGTGSLAVEFARGMPGVKVVGLDLSDVALQLARHNAQESGMSSRVSFKKGDAEDMPFEDNAFDVVISSNTLHLVGNPVRMLDEVCRVLEPKGMFFISDLRRSWLGFFAEHIAASYTPQEVEDMLSQSMLQNWELKDYLFWLSIYPKE
jgi:ubiquinone/menaquinone biosynthesis C-methylase UbiE